MNLKDDGNFLGFGYVTREVTVEDDDVDRVLYSPTSAAEKNPSHDVMVDTVCNALPTGTIETLVTSRKEWEASGRPNAAGISEKRIAERAAIWSWRSVIGLSLYRKSSSRRVEPR